MSGSLGDIRAATKAKIDEMAAQANLWRWTVITFRDSVSVLGTTTDAATAKNWLDIIGADGGGDCPNEAFGALRVAADVAPGADVLLFTAASPHGGEIELHQTITKLRARNMRVYPMILGWCNSSPFSAQQAQAALVGAEQLDPNGLFSLPVGVGPVALSAGLPTQQTAQEEPRRRVVATADLATNAPDFTVNLTPFGAGWFFPGTTQRYTLYATGNMTASNVIITLTLPNSVTYQSYTAMFPSLPGSGLTPIVTGSQVVWNIGGVQGAWEQQFDIQVAVSASAPTGVANARAEIGSELAEDATSNNSSLLPRSGYRHEIALPSVNAAVDKYLSYIPIPGQVVTYGLNIYNTGNVAYNQPVLVTDVLPANVEFITATVYELGGANNVTSTFSQNGQTLVWNLARLPSSGASTSLPVYYTPAWGAYVQVRVQPSAPVSSALQNILQIGAPPTDTNPADNVMTHTLNVNAATYDTFVVKQTVACYHYVDIRCGFVPGMDVYYSIYFGNNGNSNTTGVRITDTLPTDLTFVTTTRTLGFSVVGNQLVWDVGNLNAYEHSAGYLTVHARLKNTATPNTIFTNTIQITQNQSDTSPENNTAAAEAVVIAPVYELNVQKSMAAYCFYYPDNICQFPLGTLIDYNLYYENRGNVNAPNVVLTDTLPFDGAEFVSTSVPTGLVQSGNRLVWNLGELPAPYYPGSYNNIRVTIRVPTNASVGRLFTNTAQINTSQTEANLANNISQVQGRTVAATQDMQVSKVICPMDIYGNVYCNTWSPPSGQSPFVVGDTVQYAIIYRNAGNAPATGVRMTDTLPFAGATFITASRPSSFTVSGSQLVWDLGEVPGGTPPSYFPYTSEPLYVYLKVPPGTPVGTQFTNTVQVSLNETDIQPSNNASASGGQVVAPAVNLLTVKSANVPKTLPGRNMRYTIHVRHNDGAYGYTPYSSNTNATHVRITETLPAGVALLSYSHPQSATVSGNQIVWSLGTLVRGDWHNLTATVQTGNVPLSSILTNTVQLGSDQTELTPEDNTSSVGVLVYTPTVYIVLHKTANSDFAMPGDVVTYTLTAQQSTYNPYYLSEGDATNVVVTDVLPSGLTYVGTSQPASVTVSNNQIVWNAGTVPMPDVGVCYYDCTPAILEIYGRVNEAPTGVRLTNAATMTVKEIPNFLSVMSAAHTLRVGEPTLFHSMEAWDRIAKETGGHALRLGTTSWWGTYFESPVGINIVFKDMQTTADLLQADGYVNTNEFYCSSGYADCTGPITHTVRVDNSITQLQILAGMIGVSQVIAPDGTVVLSGTQITGNLVLTSTGSTAHYALNAPAPGAWQIVMRGQGNYRLVVSAIASPFALVSKPALPPGAPSAMKAQASPIGSASFGLFNSAGTPTATLSLLDDGAHNDGAANDGTYGGTWTPTTLGSYFLAVSGTTTLNNTPEAGAYQRLDAKPLHVQHLIVTGPGVLSAAAGSGGTAVFTVTNHANTTRTVDLTYSQTQGWASFTGAPARVQLGPGQSQNVNIAFSVPATATDFSAAQIGLLALLPTTADFGDYDTAQITARLYADVAVGGTLPGAVKPGQNLTLTIAYSNTGSIAAQGVRLTATLPPGLSYVRDTSGVTPTITGNQMVWALPALAANASGGFTLIASTAANAAGNLNIALNITTSSDEINLPNNNATPVTSVAAPRKVFLPFIRR
jgi:uncharacterized repeat protein (TIGR01451 family)